MGKIPKMKWRCVSQNKRGLVCGYHCEAECEFEPKGCLRNALFEEWEVIPDAPTETRERKEGNKRLVFRKSTQTIWEINNQGNYIRDTGIGCGGEVNFI